MLILKDQYLVGKLSTRILSPRRVDAVSDLWQVFLIFNITVE